MVLFCGAFVSNAYVVITGHLLVRGDCQRTDKALRCILMRIRITIWNVACSSVARHFASSIGVFHFELHLLCECRAVIVLRYFTDLFIWATSLPVTAHITLDLWLLIKRTLSLKRNTLEMQVTQCFHSRCWIYIRLRFFWQPTETCRSDSSRYIAHPKNGGWFHSEN